MVEIKAMAKAYMVTVENNIKMLDKKIQQSQEELRLLRQHLIECQQQYLKESDENIFYP